MGSAKLKQNLVWVVLRGSRLPIAGSLVYIPTMPVPIGQFSLCCYSSSTPGYFKIIKILILADGPFIIPQCVAMVLCGWWLCQAEGFRVHRRTVQSSPVDIRIPPWESVQVTQLTTP